MPFVSQAQRKFMYAKHPKLAKEFEGKTPKGKKLPQHKPDAKAAAMEALRRKAASA